MRAREFIIKEDEYSAVQNQLGKNPLAKKVNALTYNITDPDYRRFKDLPMMSPAEQLQWKNRADKLLARCRSIYAQLKALAPQEDQVAFNGIKLVVPLTGDQSWASADYVDRVISVDVGCFWDLSDDCLAYTIGHEMGHMVWAFGPKRNWPKMKNVKQTPQQRRQDEMDADVYGCRLAMQAGYDRRKAWDHFTVAYQREPFDPAYPQYPSVAQRKANMEKDVKSRANAAAQAQQTPAEPQQPEPQKPNPDMAEKNAWLGHIMNAMRSFETALANNPDSAVA